MKFTEQLKFNCVPEWKDYYVNYTQLKAIIDNICRKEASVLSPIQSQDEEEQHLLGHTAEEAEQEFIKALDKELAKCIAFFFRKESELRGKYESVFLDIHATEGLLATSPEALSHSEIEDSKRQQRVGFWQRPDHEMQRESLKQKMQDLYVQLNGLLEFLELNYAGFRKIVKKHDKLTMNNLKEVYQPILDAKLPMSAKPQLREMVKALEAEYGIVCRAGDQQRARLVLTKQLKDKIKFDRNTVWRDMVALERRTAAAQVQSAGAAPKDMWMSRYRSTIALVTAVGVFAALLNFPIFETEQKQNCLALLALVSILWCTEALPLFVTSMLVPFLVVTLQVLTDNTTSPPTRLHPQQAAPIIFHAMFSQVIMLLLGGFAIAAALSKHLIAKQLAATILSKVGRKPRNVLLANMLVATFASMWISNVAAPVLCYSLVLPVLRTMNPPNHPFAKSLVLGIALASNVGGMTSPISSPQNIFAIERMSMDGEPPSWLGWFAVALPVAIVCDLICWGLILLVYKPGDHIREVRPVKPPEDPMNRTQAFVIVVSTVTVGLWCANSVVQRYTGEMGVLAILPLVAFFGFGVLNKDDFNGFLWNVVMLAMGGLALGEAVKSSGLLLSITQGIEQVVGGMGFWEVMAIFCALMLVCATFISHTVSAMIILPIVQSVAEQFGSGGHSKLLVMASALMCSGAMGLPISGFPNMNAVALEDPTGANYIGSGDFLMVGVPSSILTYGVIVSMGYYLMVWLHW